MEYRSEFRMRDGRTCVIRNAAASDAEAVLAVFRRIREQTDFLLSYADESTTDAEQEAQLLQRQAESPNAVELLAEVDGTLAGFAGVNGVGTREKVRHRAEFGVSIDKTFWGLGVGRALTEACLACARRAGYVQVELAVVADNRRAIALYESLGFTAYGRNPKGFRSRTSGFQELVEMRLELNP